MNINKIANFNEEMFLALKEDGTIWAKSKETTEVYQISGISNIVDTLVTLKHGTTGYVVKKDGTVWEFPAYRKIYPLQTK